MQSLSITTDILSLKSVHAEVYSIQHYVKKCISDLRQVGVCFFPRTSVSPSNKTDCHDIAEILLNVALNTITL